MYEWLSLRITQTFIYATVDGTKITFNCLGQFYCFPLRIWIPHGKFILKKEDTNF